jgi:hypothetical protein
LRSAFKTDGINEKGEEHCLHPIIYVNTHLADHNRHEQRASHTTQLEFPKMYFSQRVAASQR